MASNSPEARRNRSVSHAADGATLKHPVDLHAAQEAMTNEQANYLKTLTHEAGEAFDPDLTRALAARKIAELEARRGKG